jgi:hypothetical protein
MSSVDLRVALVNVAKRARTEALAGAPAGMVATYVELEVRHALAGHISPEWGVHCQSCSLKTGTPLRADISDDDVSIGDIEDPRWYQPDNDERTEE